MASKINPFFAKTDVLSLNYDVTSEFNLKDRRLKHQGWGELREDCGWESSGRTVGGFLGSTHLSLLDARVDGVQEVCPVLVTLR